MHLIFSIVFSSLLIASTPSVITDKASLISEKIDSIPLNIKDLISRGEETLSEYSNNNRDVLETGHLFLSHLVKAHSAGEITDLDFTRILQGMEFAAKKHQKQIRKNEKATPYIIHPIGVADHLLTLGRVRDPSIIIAALLHDTVEDTQTTFEEIQTVFGESIKDLVREVTDDKSLSKSERKALQITHAPEKSSGAAQIKLADKLYNLNDLLTSPPSDWEKSRIDEYFDWAEKVTHALPAVNKPLLNAVDRTIALFRSN